MAKPSKKFPAINEPISKVMGKDRETTISQNNCMVCKKKVGKFRDKQSEKEYSISGLCQDCQDDVWAPSGSP